MKNDGRFGPNKKGGRKPGVPNKLTHDIKLMILEAFDKAGGVEYLVEQSKTNPSAFMTLLGKITPTTVSGDPNAPMKFIVERRIVRSDS